MVTIGFVWFVAQLLRSWLAPVPLTAGIWLGDLWLLPLAFLLAGFPLARLANGIDRALFGALAIVMIPLELLWLMFLELRLVRRGGRSAQRADGRRPAGARRARSTPSSGSS